MILGPSLYRLFPIRAPPPPSLSLSLSISCDLTRSPAHLQSSPFDALFPFRFVVFQLFGTFTLRLSYLFIV